MSRHRLLISVALATLTAIVFAPVVGYSFINYDDGAYVTENPHVLSGLSRANVAWAFSFGSSEATSNWHPLTWLSLMADVTLFGVNAPRMHLVNLIIHILNAWLLFAILTNMTQAHWPSAFVAAVFAIHPLHVESVAWISERKDVLSTFFVLLAIISYLRAINGPKIRWHVIAIIFYILSLLSKQMYVTLPFLLLLIDFWPLGRVREGAGDVESDRRPTTMSLIIEKLPYLVLAILFSAIAFVGQRHGGAVGSFEEFTATQRCLNSLVSYVDYLWQTILPVNLAVFYPYPNGNPWGKGIFALAILAAITVFLVRMRARQPHLIMGWLWYIGTLVPVIGLVQIGRQRMADRYMYFPMIGLLIGLTWMATKWANGQPHRVSVLRVVAALIVVGFALIARIQASYWQDSATLFTHSAKVAESSLAYTKLGYERAQLGEFAAAAYLFHRALVLDPEYVAAHTSLGNTSLAEGNPQEAIRHFRKAVELDPDHAEAHYNLGIIYSMQGKPRRAVEHYQNALRVDPDNADVHANLGIAFLMDNQEMLALKHLQRSVQIKPDLPESHFALGKLLMSLGRDKEAVEHFQTVLKARTANTEVHRKLAQLYERLGDVQRAGRHRNLAGSEQ